MPNALGRDVALRTIEIEGEPWFVAKDACLCLGFAIRPGGASASDYVQGLLQDERRVLRRSEMAAYPPIDKETKLSISALFGAGNAARLALINESGLDRLSRPVVTISRSQLPLTLGKETLRPGQIILGVPSEHPWWPSTREVK